MSNGTEPPRLLVPIHIDGLVVGKLLPSDEIFQWTNLAPDFSKLQPPTKSYFFGSELVGESGNLFVKAIGLDVTGRPPISRKPGIHLHFRLPRALTHGSQSRTEKISFPAIPNRWLVQRFGGSGAANGKLSYKAWLIKSDGKPAEPSTGITWPTFHKDKPVEFQKIGTCTEVTGPLAEQDETALMTITAIGPGDPAFSAYYPACRGVLGFYDDMKDVPEGTQNVPKGTRLCYLVTGWYSDPRHDPLAKFSPGELTQEQQEKQFTELQAWAKEEAWNITDEKPQLITSNSAANPTVVTTLVPHGLENNDKIVISGVSGSNADLNKEHTVTVLSPTTFSVPVDARGDAGKGGSFVRSQPSEVRTKPHTPPERLLCHGLVRGITWQGPDHNYMQFSEGAALSQPAVFPVNTDNHDKAYKLAVGNTAAEAVAALLAPGEVDQDLLTALQGDLLSQSVTAAELQYELHERRFNGVRGGSIFLIRQEPDLPDANKAAEPPKPGGANSIPASLRKLLRDLNAKQQRCDEISRRVEDLRWQVYALWYLWTNEIRHGVTEDKEPRVKLLQGQLAIAKEVLKTEQTAWNLAKKEWDDSEGSLINELGKQLKTQPDGTPRLRDGKPELKYRLAPSPALPFQRPSDPVIAVQGPAMTRLNTWFPTGKLECRISGQEVAGITLAIPSGPVVTVTGEQLIAELFTQPEKLPVPGGIHRSLLLEALLLDDRNAAAIARLASAQYEKELTNTVKALQNPQNTAAQAESANFPNVLRCAEGIRATIEKDARIGRLPDQSFPIKWEGNPWIPLFLVWEVSWQSDYPSPGEKEDPLPQDLLTSRWNLGDNAGGDLLLIDAGTNRASSAQEATYQGYAILTPSAANNLAKRLETLNESHPLVNVLKNQRVLAQSLDGFNDALVLQQPGIQLPPLDYDKWYASRGRSYEIVSFDAALYDGFDERRDTFRTAPRVAGKPLPLPFLPIRAGRLKITRLSIVDAFGQTLILPVNAINESAEKKDAMLRPAHSCVVGAPGTAMTLRPRFAQPMRLRFEWENASGHPEERGGPVCGWVLPNHLEKSLTIYSASGKPLGALQKKLGLQSGSPDPAFYWVGAPGAASVTIENRHLLYFRDWILGLIPDDGAIFSACIDHVMASADERVPETDPGVSVLVGHPLALVRASLQFETAGLPAHRPELLSGDAGGAAVDTLLDTLSFKQVKWPLRLGDIQARNDGLVGVFQCAPASLGGAISTSGAFYPAWGEKRDVVRNAVQVFAVQDFKIDCVQPLQVTMLMDPQARVHAMTGALPRAYIELPSEDATGARRAREVFFQTAPVLGLSAMPEMPRPSDDYGEWSWAYRPDVTSWKLDPAIVEATDRAAFSDTWPTIAEGWLKLVIAPVKVLSFWVREGAEAVASGTRIHLAWSLQGAESLKLEQIQKDGPLVPLAQWDAQPFPREYGVIVQAETTYRLTAFAEDAPPSAKVLTITTIAASTPGS